MPEGMPDTNRFSICTTTNFLKAVRDMTSTYADILQRIQAALDAAREVFARFTPGAVATEYKAGHDPVTEADRAVDAVLRQNLLRDGEGWLSEETVDNPDR